MSFSQEEIEEFKAEALELLEIAEKSLLALDEGADFKSSFDAVFRGFHNLKGAAGVMELTALQSHTHELENILMTFKKKDSIPKEYISLFLRGIDACRTLLDGRSVEFDFSVEAHQEPPVASKGAEIPKEALDEFIAECDEIVDRVSKYLHSLESGDHKKEYIDDVFRDIHSMKGSAFLYSHNSLGSLAHAMESSLERVREGTHLISKDLLNALFKTLETIEKVVDGIKKKVADGDLEKDVPALVLWLQFASEGLEAAPASTDASVAKEAAAKSSECSVPDVTKATSKEQNGAMKEKDKEGEGASSIRVSVSLLDNLMNLMGEMVLVRNQVLQYSNRSDDLDFAGMSKRLNVVTSEIQGELMKTRMQPIGNVLTKFNRVVRDLSQELHKKINLQLSGAETELDKSLLEAIKDPLTHIVRNSCDHGIETPDIRKKAGKPESGTISIKAYHEGGQVIIDIYDDGKGLHPDVIRKKAIEKGLINLMDAAKLTEKEIFSLIFAPGFSTASQITNVSGRGVGMDVVRTNIERIGGAIDLNSVPGFGTSIKLKIPLTLAIVPALVVKCGQGIYAIPQLKLEELVRVDEQSGDTKIEMLHGAPIYRLRGNILPLINLKQVLKIEDSEASKNEVINIAVLNDDRGAFGLIIDEIIDTVDIVVKPINRLLKSLQIYSGATMLGNGSVALILDVIGLSKVAKLERERANPNEGDLHHEDRFRLTNDRQDYLLFRVHSQTKHALVLGYVYRLEEFRRTQIEYVGSRPMVRYGKTVLPLIFVSEQLGYADRMDFDEVVSVVVVQRAGTLYGLVVDQVLDIFSSSVDLDAATIRQLGIFGSLSTKDELIVVINPFEVIERSLPHSAPERVSVVRDSSSQPGLAFAPPPQADSKSTKFTTVEAGQGRILLAEDTLFFRKAMTKILENQGYQVTAAIDGRDAYDILVQTEQPFDLIVSDIEMPRMNGFQLAEMIRQNPQISHLPLLAISSRAENDFVMEGRKAGFDIYLEKLQPKLLVGAVTELLSKKRSVA